MAADGSLKFDTKIDTSGLEKGTGTLEKASGSDTGFSTEDKGQQYNDRKCNGAE